MFFNSARIWLWSRWRTRPFQITPKRISCGTWSPPKRPLRLRKCVFFLRWLAKQLVIQSAGGWRSTGYLRVRVAIWGGKKCRFGRTSRRLDKSQGRCQKKNSAWQGGGVQVEVHEARPKKFASRPWGNDRKSTVKIFICFRSAVSIFICYRLSLIAFYY